MRRCACVLSLLMSMVQAHGQEIPARALDALIRPSPIAPLPGRIGYSMSTVPLDAAQAINNAGAIVGQVNGQAAMYYQGAVTLLPQLEGFTSSRATDISHNGQIVGTGISAGKTRGLYWANTTSQPVVISYRDDTDTFATSINSSGTVVGYYQRPAPAYPQAFRWTASEHILRNLSGGFFYGSKAYDISEAGYSAGVAYVMYGLGQKAARFDTIGQGGWFDDAGPALRALDNGTAFGRGIGGSVLWTQLYEPGSPIGPEPFNHVVTARNDSKRWVGYRVAEPPYGLAWTSVDTGGAIYLPTPSNAQSSAKDVNACGTILGDIIEAGGRARPVYWTKLLCDIPPIVAQ